MVTKVSRDVADLLVRPIAGINFQTSAQIKVNTANVPTNVLATDGSSALTTIGYSSSNTPNTIMLRDSSGNVSVVASSAKWADLAEMYRADAPYEPGTLVSLGGQYEITAAKGSSWADQVEVFGVISTAPAYLMNDDERPADEHWLPVGLIGRVPMKVLGPVGKGDRLMASAVPGIAKAVPISILSEISPFAIIGRAIESSDDPGVKLVMSEVGVK